MENVRCSSAPPNTKYNCIVLFLSQWYILCIYASKYFLIGHHCKCQAEFSNLLAKGKIYWTSCRVCRMNRNECLSAMTFLSLTISGGSMIFLGAAARCANLFYLPKTAWKWKNLDPGTSLEPPLRSATDSRIWINDLNKLLMWHSLFK